MAGLRVNQRNAKLYNNVGHSLESQGRYLEALKYFQDAIRVQPDDIGAYINVGRTYHHLHMYEEAEKAFRQNHRYMHFTNIALIQNRGLYSVTASEKNI
ncbi:protein O-mannosyl-transferase Tmtc3 [Trichonephila clavipes]|uniref:Protein O-mannosyl-transferase Tmtc3 n=1 Tax=Trichonephila clavipes TaxID=2585209 RepID=A0A8X6R8Y7_TRICX|nr:protein O-mannosyl-transferase Tmtc3 [Trichonephila clavipes]